MRVSADCDMSLVAMRHPATFAILLAAIALLAACGSSSSSSSSTPADLVLDAGVTSADASPSPAADGAPAGLVPCEWNTTPLDQCTWQ